MGVAQIWRMLWAKRLFALIGIVIGVVCAVLAYRAIPSQYVATSRVILDFVKPDPVSGQAITAPVAKAYVETQSELVTDFRVASAVVDAFGWMNSRELQQAYQNSAGRSSTDYRHWLAEIVAANTSAELVDKSNILEISYTTTSPEIARKAADAIRNAYIEQTLAAKRESAVGNARWFQRQAESLKKSLAAAEARKSRFERENGILLQDDNVDTETARLRAIASSAPPPPVAVAAAAAAAAPSSGQLAQVDAQIAGLRRTLGPNHPDLQALLQQRQALASAVVRETAAARTSVRPGASGPSQASMIDAQTRKVLAQRGLVGEAQRLAGDVTVLRDQVTKTMQRAADFELQGQTTESGLEPLGNAALPAKSSRASMWLFLLGGLAMGAVLGCAAGLLVELLFRRVRGVEDLEAEGLPVLAAMKRPVRRSNNLLEWLGMRAHTSERISSV